VFDSIVRKYGATVALVYGKIWRYCDWSDLSVCTASNKRLAEELDMSESTVKRAKTLLKKDRFIYVTGKSGGTDTVTVMHEAVMNLDIEIDVSVEQKTPHPNAPRPEPEKKGDLLTGITAVQGKDISWMWPDTQDKITKLPPRFWKGLTKKEHKRWNQHVRTEWSNHSKEVVAQAWKVHADAGLVFGGPWSLDWAFKNLEPIESDLDKRRKDVYG